MSDYPWQSRFEGISDGLIEKRLHYIPSLPDNIETFEVELSCNYLRKALSELFVPTKKSVKIACKLVNLAQAHSAFHYSDKKQFMRDLYLDDYDLKNDVRPYFFTGLSGYGKTAICLALDRVIPESGSVYIKKHSPFPLKTFWRFTIPGTLSLSKLLQQMLGKDVANVKKKNDLSELISTCQWKAHYNGYSVIIIDEMQFLTRSATANALISQFLLHVSKIGVPVVYVGNFSLGHKLKKRPPEDKERLLANPIILLPDEPDSIDWKSILQCVQAVCPDIFTFDFVEESKKMYGWTSGSKRMLKRLVVKSYEFSRLEKRMLELVDVENIFKSIDFAGNREQIMQMHELFITGDSKNKDLICPYETPDNTYKKQKDMLEAERQRQVVQSLAVSTMSQEEQNLYQELDQAAKGSEQASVTNINRGKKKKRTLEQIRNAEKHL